LRAERVTTGALVAKAKTNHFVMAHIKVLNLHQSNIKRLKVKLSISAGVSKLPTCHYAMVHTANYRGA